MTIIDVTQLLNLVSHSLEGSSGNKQCFQCAVFLWAFKSSGRKWTMKHLLPAERLPFTRVSAAPQTTFLKGHHALVPSRYPHSHQPLHSFLQEPLLSLSFWWQNMWHDGLSCMLWWFSKSKHTGNGIILSETGYSTRKKKRKKKWYDLIFSHWNWLNYEKWVFHTRMEPDLNASMLK